MGLLPILFLLLLTFSTLWRQRSDILVNPLLLGTTFAFIYLLLVENMFKTGMRQPYPGIITFFIWGLLINRLSSNAADKTISV
jgi:hypothetical protein